MFCIILYILADYWAPPESWKQLSKFAVKGGQDDEEGNSYYVGRCTHEGDFLPANVIPDLKYASVTLNGQEYIKHDYEILIGPGYSWIPFKGGHISDNAIYINPNQIASALYIGRTIFRGRLIMGKIQSTDQSLYIPFKQQEVKVTPSEILVRQPADSWMPVSLDNFPASALVAGYDNGGVVSYVARAKHDDFVVPAKYLPGKGLAFIASDGLEIPIREAEILIGSTSYKWIKPQDRNVPTNAVFTGRARDGMPLCVGRAYLRETIIPGLVSFEGQFITVPYQGRGRNIISYDILVKE